MSSRQNKYLLTYNIQLYDTGKSFSEALILESVNPQYDNEFPEKYKIKTCCVQILF